jgi:rSAM/selenodomain-associated transferase 1
VTTLGIFARLPEPGKTKTRLAAAISDQAAAQLYAAFVRDLLDRSCSLADRICVAATPESDAAATWFKRHMPAEAELRFQPQGDLGSRIRWFFETALSEDDRAVLIGSDSPDIPSALIQQAFSRLSESDIVIAPAFDGGFVLIGMKTLPGNCFDGIGWSTPTTLLQALDAASTHGLSVSLLPPWYDIDTVDNLPALKALLDSADPSSPDACPATSATLQQLWPTIQSALS